MKQKGILIGILSFIVLLGVVSFIWWESQMDRTSVTDNVKGVREDTFSSEIILEIFNGPVTVVANGKAINAKNGMALKQGYVVATSENGRAQIVFPNGTVTRLDRSTTITLEKAQVSPQQVEILVNDGQIWSRIAELLQNETYLTVSENINASVRGTSYGHSLINKIDQIITTKGEVVGSCANKKQEGVVSKGQKGVFTCGDDNLEIINISNNDIENEWLQFNSEQDEGLNNRFGPFTYRDNEDSSVLGLATNIFQNAREIANNTINRITNTISNSTSNNTNQNTANNNQNNNSNTNTNSNTTASNNNPINTPAPTTGSGGNTGGNNGSNNQNNNGGTSSPTPVQPTSTPVPRSAVASLKLDPDASATIYDPETNSTKNATNGTPIYADNKISVTGGMATIQYNREDTLTRVDSGTTVVVRNNSDTSFQTTVQVEGLGRIWNRVKKLGGQESFESDTGTMVATVRGTHYAHLKTTIDNEPVDQIFTIEGSVFGKCKNFPDKAGLIVPNKKTRFNCISDSINSFLQSLNNLDTEDADWLIRNVAIDLPGQLSGNRRPAIGITVPKESEEFNFADAASAVVTVKADIDDDGKPFGEPGVFWVCTSFKRNSNASAEPCFLNAVFENQLQAETNVKFNMSGEYTFMVVASDVETTTTKDVTFTVNISQENIAPEVNAGPDKTVNVPDKADLSGTVTDDGLPLRRPLFNTWSLVKGPQASMVVRIENPFSLQTKIDFSRSVPPNVTGEYIFRLSSFDGSKYGTDDVKVVLMPPIPTNTNTPTPSKTPTPSHTPTPSPTPSPAASLEVSADKKEVKLKIENLFTYKSLSYVFNYESAEGQQGGKGSAGLIIDNRYEKVIPFGTCSSGVCTYHTDPKNVLFKIDIFKESSESVKLETRALTTPSPTPTITATPSPTPTNTPTPTPIPESPAPTITKVTRNSLTCGFFTCSATITIDGSNYVSGATVKAYGNTQLGTVPFNGTIQSFGTTSLRVVFNSLPKNTTLDVRVTNPDTKTATKNAAFATN